MKVRITECLQTGWLKHTLRLFSGYPRHHIAHNITESIDRINFTVTWKLKIKEASEYYTSRAKLKRKSHANLSIGTDVDVLKQYYVISRLEEHLQDILIT